MADEKKRIINETTDTALASSGDYVIVDSQTEGTRKFDLGAELAAIDTALGTKVDKVTGKGLSTEDYTTAEKTKLSGIEAQANKTVLDTELATAGKAADAKATGDQISQLKEDLTAEETAREAADNAINTELATKADADGTIASAEQLLSDKHTVDQVPYLFRPSGGSGADREYDEIVGGSIVWNQLNAKNNNRQRAINGLTFTVNNDGSVDVTGTCTASDTYSLNNVVDAVASHKYYIKGALPANSDRYITFSGVVRQNGEDGAIISASTAQVGVNLYVKNGYSANLKVYPQIFDLTQMFGSTIADYIYSLEQATAGAGVAWFKKLFPKDYYAYNAGTMMHVSGLSSHDTVGFNQSNEWEFGNIDVTGQDSGTSQNYVRTKGYIKAFPSTTYCLSYNGNSSNSVQLYVLMYDADKNLQSRTQLVNNITDANAYRTFTTNADTAFIRAFIYGTTAFTSVDSLDKCINLSWDGERDGEYEPYEKHSYPLDDSLALRGIPKLDSNNRLYYDGDTYAADGAVTRKYGIVDLGTLSWLKYDVAQGTLFRTTIGDSKQSANDTTSLSNIICSKYVNVGQSSRSNKTISRPEQSRNFDIIDNDYTDVASFKTAMSGVYLVYELATPTTEEAAPFTNPQVCDPYGTEEYVTTSLVPVGHYTKYPANLRSAIERVMEQVPEAPSANGTYTLKATRTSSGVTYAWTAE